MMMMMMGRILLNVFYFSGCLILSTDLLHEYHFVTKYLNWGDAQSYCRQNYTDLATIDNTDEMQQVINIASAGSNSKVWIGMWSGHYAVWTYYIRNTISQWVNQTKKDQFLPYYGRSFSINGGWQWENSFVEHPFVCSNGSQEVYVNQSMDWFRACKYCRENFTDLVSIGYSSWTSSSWLYNAGYNNQNMNNLVPPTERVWIGFIHYYLFNWSDGSSSSFRNWDNLTYSNVSGSAYGAVDLQRSGKWTILPYGNTLPFVCYTNRSTPEIEKKSVKVFRLRFSSSVDLNIPDVNENILKQLEDRLKENGVSGIKLSWRQQPDGKIFH